MIDARSASQRDVPLLEARRIERRADQTVLLHDISLTLSQGTHIALVGPSGGGKTLLLRALAMLDPLAAGEIRWHGELVAGDRIPLYRSRVMHVPQRPVLIEGTVEDNLRQPFSFRVHQHKQFDTEWIVQLLRALGRDAAFLSKQYRDLSGGEAQLIALLRAMQLGPEVLLLDEPTSALDAQATELVESLVHDWRCDAPTARATIWVSHDLPQARRMSTTVLQMQGGRLMMGAGDERLR